MNNDRDGIIHIIPDNWDIGGNLHTSQWSRAQAMIESGKYVDTFHAVNVKITGRGSQLRNGSLWIRVKLEFVHDDEPSTFYGGWLYWADRDRLAELQAAHSARLQNEELDNFGCFSGKLKVEQYAF